jgi:hypothetical protein
MEGHSYLELTCVLCGHRTVVGPVQMLEKLRDMGMLRREKEPDLHVVYELFMARLAKLPCDSCHQVGLTWQPIDDGNDEDWDQVRNCEVCHARIPPERLEVFPDARRCKDCQQSADRGEDSAQPEYCPRCGAIMQLRMQRGSGITRYVMSCPDCGR